MGHLRLPLPVCGKERAAGRRQGRDSPEAHHAPKNPPWDSLKKYGSPKQWNILAALNRGRPSHMDSGGRMTAMAAQGSSEHFAG